MKNFPFVGKAVLALALMLWDAAAVRGQAVDTIYGGRPAFVVRPFTDTVDVVRVTGSTRERMSMMVTVAAVGPGSDMTIRSTTDGVVYTTRVNSATFAPRYSRTQAPTDSAEATYDGLRVRGWAVPMGEQKREIDVTVPVGELPLSAEGALLRVLPWRDGYSALLRKHDLFANVAGWVAYRVTGADTASHRGRVVDAWIIEESTGTGQAIRRYWINKTTGQLIKALNLRVRSGSEIWWFFR